MSLLTRIVTALLFALACASAFANGGPSGTADGSSGGASSSDAEPATPESGIRPQVYPATRLSTLFPAAVQISFAVAVVPDPLVPRYRRPYDLEIVALELGMLHDGYVLDRFYLPWNADLRRASTATSAQQGPMAYRYGLMIFRCDAWRSRDLIRTPDPASRPANTACNAPVTDASTHGTHIRALYIVTDTATKGLEGEALLCAMDRINSQLSGDFPAPTVPMQRFKRCWQWLEGAPAISTESPAPRAALLSYPDTCETPDRAATLLVLGPNFSGGVDSAGEVGNRFQLALGADLSRQPLRGMCLLSSSATDGTNVHANEIWSRAPFPVRYASLALENYRKLRHLHELLPELIGRPLATASDQGALEFSPVAILAEASTYGYGVCGYADDPNNSVLPGARKLCVSARRLYFPANIADIRYGMQQNEQHRARDNPLELAMPPGHLPLDLGAENGSEYPESRQSGLTSASIQLALERVLQELRAHPPKLVVVVATDVRDRLFLFDALRKRLPRTMLVDLESDNLIGHPDFLHASRGALAIGSAKLTTGGSAYTCVVDGGSRMMSTWSTDFQAILADAVSRLYDPAQERSQTPCSSASFRNRPPELQVISLEGLRSVTSTRSSAPGRGRLAGAEMVAPFSCLAVAWLLIGPLVRPHWRPDPDKRRALSWSETIAAGFALLLPASAWVVAFWVHERDEDNLLLLVTIVFSCATLLGLGVCVRLLRHAARTAPPANLRNVAAPVILGLSAACFATLPSFWYASVQSFAPSLDVAALEDLALDPDPGLAFLLLVALATFTLLYACAVLATGAAIVSRNSAILRQDPDEAVACAPVAMPVAPMQWVGGTETVVSMARVPAAEPVQMAEAAQIAQTGQIAQTIQTVGPSTTARLLPNRQPATMRDASQHYRPELRGALQLNPFGVLVAGALVILCIVLPDFLEGNIRLTIFGPFASRVALLALMATSLSATVLFACSLGTVRRISAVARYLATARKQSSPRETVGRWPADVHGPRVFPPTPVVARATDAGAPARKLLGAGDLAQWRLRVSEWLRHGHNDGAHRAAIFTLLATEISLFRWCVLGTVLCALASIGAVYLFPIEADPLLIVNLLLLLGIGAVAAFAATSFERDALLSNLLCNRAAPRRFSTPLFMFVSVPFIALAIALAIAQVPGVVDWGGGILHLLAGLGLHG